MSGEASRGSGDGTVTYMVHYAAHGVLEPGEQPGITQLVQTVAGFLEARAAP